MKEEQDGGRAKLVESSNHNAGPVPGKKRGKDWVGRTLVQL